MIPNYLRWRALARAVAGACVSAGVPASLCISAYAQSPDAKSVAPVGAAQRSPEPVEEIIVEDEANASTYRTDRAELTKLTEPLRDVPQSIVSVPREVFDDRGATSLNDALRTVPGITLGAGEFSWQGNNPNLRGFSSRNDMFLDGMRDFGSYPRDPFDLESVDVLQGPSSMIFGRGSTGGVINQVSKRPALESLTAVNVNGGSADTLRGAADVMRPLPAWGPGAAFRIDAVAHDGGVAGRDVVETERYGVAPSLAFGLGGPTQVEASYFKQATDDIPDYGLPWFNGRPADVPRHNFYGFESDYLKTDADIFSVDVQHQHNDWIQVHGLARDARYDRQSRLTEPLIDASVPPTTPLDQITVTRNVFAGHSVEAMTAAQGDVTLRFATGGVTHAVVTGIEAARESSAPSFGFGVGVPGTNLVQPTPWEPFTATSLAPRLIADTDADSLAAYGLDTIKLGKAWQLVAGARWDRFAADYHANRFDVSGNQTSTEHIERTDRQWSYRAGVVYKPSEIGTAYLSWGTSFNPSAETLSFITSGRALGTQNAFLAPEENESYELGTKWGLARGALALDAALFQITRTTRACRIPTTPGSTCSPGRNASTV